MQAGKKIKKKNDLPISGKRRSSGVRRGGGPLGPWPPGSLK
jgi:hypothetical protein